MNAYGRLGGTELLLPSHRAARPINDWWEAQRLAATRSRIRALDADLKRAPKIIDCGAEEGDFPTLYSIWGAEVFCVEPNGRAWPWIRRTFEMNGLRPAGYWVGLLGSPEQNQQSVEAGLMDESSIAGNRLDTCGTHFPPCANEEEPTPEHGFQHLSEHMDVTPTWTLDFLVEDTKFVPDIVTIDVEGGEFHLLTGALDVLTNDRPEVFVSIHPEFLHDLYGHEKRDVLNLFEDFDYRCQFICADHEEHWHAVPRERPWPWSDPH